LQPVATRGRPLQPRRNQLRMHMRRFIRLTNGFSKKATMRDAVSLHFLYYNFARIHQTLRVTPAMEAGIVLDPISWTPSER
jgi:hypothetical protein